MWGAQPSIGTTALLVVFAVAVALAVYSFLDNAAFFPGGQVSSFLVALPIAWLAAAVIGYALGVPVLRLRGDYLAIVTLGFGEISSLALRNLESITGGPAGAINFPKPLPPDAGAAVTNLTMLYIGIAGAALIMLASLNLRNSRVGRAWLAMKSDEDIAQAMGINLVNVKLLAFTIGSSFGGLAGLLFGSRQNSVYPEDFELQVSINIISVVIIGGMGSVPGVILGAIALVGLPELLRPINDYRIMAFGLLLIVTMVTLPRGLMPAPPPALEDRARALAEAEGDTNEGII
ncbi:MAG: branched-chain amino acid ABC transporter permease [Anaerolineales bacterium]